MRNGQINTFFNTQRVLVFANEALKCQSLVTVVKLVADRNLLQMLSFIKIYTFIFRIVCIGSLFYTFWFRFANWIVFVLNNRHFCFDWLLFGHCKTFSFSRSFQFFWTRSVSLELTFETENTLFFSSSNYHYSPTYYIPWKYSKLNLCRISMECKTLFFKNEYLRIVIESDKCRMTLAIPIKILSRFSAIVKWNCLLKWSFNIIFANRIGC